MVEALLEIRDLVTEFRTDQGTVRAVDGVSFEVPRRGTVGVVGESGCGKSVTALSIMRLVASPPGRIASGQIRYGGRDLLALPEAEMRAIRGNRIAMIFQEPMTSLNPVFTVGDQVGEAVRLHQKKSRRDARRIAIEMFRLVGIPSPEERVDAYPHQLSGGMRQRVMIAMALACKPDLLIADEPTTALDVTIQAQILDLLRSLQVELGMSILLITHDLGVVAETCDEVIVMYAGRVVEQAPAERLFAHPRHPYTAGLLRSVPSYGDGATADGGDAGAAGAGQREVPAGGAAAGRKPRLVEIKGMVPPLTALPPGCKFADRCAIVQERCRREEPALVAIGGTRVRCHFPLEPAALVESALLEPAPVEAAPAESAPAEAALAESAPAESAPAESAPAESAPAESALAEAALAEAAPAESAPAESAPAEVEAAP
jgi:peptide/nickel transport system ATP-binding protein